MASGYLNTLPKNIERRKDISNLGDKMKHGLPSKIIKKYGVTKKAWAVYRKRKK